MEMLSKLQTDVLNAFGVSAFDWVDMSDHTDRPTTVPEDNAGLPQIIRQGAEIMRKIVAAGGSCRFTRVIRLDSCIIFSATGAWEGGYATACYSVPLRDKRKLTVSSRGRQFFAKGAIVGPEVIGLRAVRRELRAIWES